MTRDDSVHITNRIRRLRSERDITQAALADAIAVTRVTISCIERGEYHPSLELALKLARFFGVAVEEVFRLEDRDTP
jgi:putative transcriptional regulator